jgi:hypothetical protein
MSSIRPEKKVEYTRKSEKESICLSCYNTVRADRYTALEEAEHIHSEVCLMRTDHPLPFGSD